MEGTVGTIENPIEKLDYVLKYFAGKVMTMRIRQFYQDKYFADYERATINVIINKLVKDGFVTYSEDKEMKEGYATVTGHIPAHEVAYSTYIVSLEGLIFYNRGGYKEEERIKELEIRSLEIDVRTRRRNERLIVWGTWVAAIGVTIAAVYYIQEIGKYLCWW